MASKTMPLDQYVELIEETEEMARITIEDLTLQTLNAILAEFTCDDDLRHPKVLEMLLRALAYKLRRAPRSIVKEVLEQLSLDELGFVLGEVAGLDDETVNAIREGRSDA